jgi:hypothetical protein
MGMILRKFMVAMICFCVAASVLPTESFAQQNEASAPELTGTRKQVATIIFAGLAGAILGLSTLSFYGKPQEELSNIAVGFAVGIIGGVAYTSYNIARSPYEGLQSMELQRNYDDELSKRLATPVAFKPALAWSF